MKIVTSEKLLHCGVTEKALQLRVVFPAREKLFKFIYVVIRLVVNSIFI